MTLVSFDFLAFPVVKLVDVSESVVTSFKDRTHWYSSIHKEDPPALTHEERQHIRNYYAPVSKRYVNQA